MSGNRTRNLHSQGGNGIKVNRTQTEARMRSVGASAIAIQQAEKLSMQRANVDLIGPVNDQETMR